MSQSAETMTPLELLQRSAMQFNDAVITPDQAPYVRFPGVSTLEQLNQQFEAQVQKARADCDQAIRSLEPVLSAFLRTEDARQILQSVLSVLRSELQSRRLHDVETEVLVTWLAESSGSSSGGSDGESAGELPTPSRTETAPDREDGQ